MSSLVVTERNRNKKNEIMSVEIYPVGIWCHNDVASALMRRHQVASTLIRRHFMSCARWVCVPRCNYIYVVQFHSLESL